jgi:putative flippase GtrA
MIRIIKERKQTIHEILKFCVVGGLCTGIDACIFYSLLRFTSYQVALISGYCLSLVLNYILTIFWTFQKKPTTRNAMGVVVAHLFNLFVIRMGLMNLFVCLMKLESHIAYIPTLLISVIINFIMVRFVVNKLS